MFVTKIIFIVIKHRKLYNIAATTALTTTQLDYTIKIRRRNTTSNLYILFKT